MKIPVKNHIILFLLLFIASSSFAQRIKTIVTDTAFIQTMLTEHNNYRKELKLPLLSWSPQLAASSLQWAVYLAANNKFEHSTALKTIGENIWMGTSNAFTWQYMVQDWGNEKIDFVYAVFPNCSKSNAEVGHFTQMVWKATTQVGCAIASNGNYDYLVCRYNPAGNYIGQKPY